MRETLKKWEKEEQFVEIMRNDACTELIYGNLIFLDEKTLHVKGEYKRQLIIPWTKVARIRDLSNKYKNTDELIKFSLVNIYYNGPQRIMSHGFLEKMDEKNGIVTISHYGVRDIHPMNSIQRIEFICENGGLDI